MKLKDNKIFRWIVIPICLAMCFFGQFVPPFPGLVSTSTIPGVTNDAMGVIFIFLGSLILWLTIGIDWPSILCIFSLAFLKSTGFKMVFTNSFGNETFLFLLFTFVCTYALSKTPFIKRVATSFINFKLAKKNGYWFTFLFLLGVLILGLFISPTVLFVIILPILNEIFDIAKIDKGDKVGKVLMMGLGFTVSISSGMTPIAHVFPVLAMSNAGVSVSPLSYMAMAIPVGIILFLFMFLIFRIMLKKDDVKKLENVDVSYLKTDLGKMNKAEKISLIIFIVVILLWIIPSFFKDSYPDFYNAINQYGTAMPPLAGVIALCIIRVDDKPLINAGDAFKNGVPWGSLLMCAATLVLGVCLTNDAIGIKTFLKDTLGPSLVNLPAIVLLIIFALWAAIQTNVSSNMVTATLVSSVAAFIISTGAVSLSLPAVACVIGMLASFAFATPPSMPHIAIVAGSDYCDTKSVLIYGGILMIASIIFALVIAYPIGMCLL